MPVWRLSWQLWATRPVSNAKKPKNRHLSLVGNLPQVDQFGLAANVKVPDDEKVIVKEVPAKVDGTVVGTAQIYEDGTVGVVLDEEAPQWALDKIKSQADILGFSIGTDI